MFSGNWSSKHPFSGAMLVSGRVYIPNENFLCCANGTLRETPVFVEKAPPLDFHPNLSNVIIAQTIFT